MTNEIIKILKEKYDEKELKKIIFYLNTIYKEYTKNYDFLTIKKEDWLKLFLFSVKESPKTTYLDKSIIDNYITNLIKKYNEEKNTEILDNLLLKLINCNNKITLNNFFAILDNLKIKIDENYFLKLKNDSELFKTMLAKSCMQNYNYQEILMMRSNNYTFYVNLKINNHGLQWVIEKFNEINNLLIKKINIHNTNNLELREIKLILKNYDSIVEISNNEPKLKKTICNYNYNKLRKLFIQYKELKENNISLDNLRDSIRPKKQPHEEANLSIYNYFPLINNNTLLRIKLVDYLFNELDKQEQALIITKIKEKKLSPTDKVIINMKRRYIKLAVGPKAIKKRRNNSYKDIIGQNQQDYYKCFIIDFLWDYLSDYEQNLFESFLNNEFSYHTFYGNKVEKIIHQLESEYNKIIDLKFLPPYALLEMIIVNSNDNLKDNIEKWYKLGRKKRKILRDMLNILEYKYMSMNLTRKDLICIIQNKLMNKEFNFEVILDLLNEDRIIEYTL